MQSAVLLLAVAALHVSQVHAFSGTGFAGLHAAATRLRGNGLFPLSCAPPRTKNCALSMMSEVPKWATTFETGEVIETITLSKSKQEIAVKVMNQEVSWEDWYAALVGAGGVKNAAAMAVKLTPTLGAMAPRGKEAERIRLERDDPTDNYKDFALVGVEVTREGLGYLDQVKGGGKDELSEKPLYLVIKTEQKSWTYQVKLDASS